MGCGKKRTRLPLGPLLGRGGQGSELEEWNTHDRCLLRVSGRTALALVADGQQEPRSGE